MKIAKIRDVKTPSRGTKGSAGIDFYVPNDFQKQYVLPGEQILIPSGIKVNIPEGFCLIGFNKSSVAVKGLSAGAVVVDEDFQGEIKLNLINTSINNIEIEPGQKIIQFILMPVVYCDIEETNLDQLYSEITERGEGGFGSTGSK